MKKIMSGIALIACVLTAAGWGSVESEKKIDHARGDIYADNKRQANDEDIKRTQGDESGRRDVHTQGPLQNDNRGQW